MSYWRREFLRKSASMAVGGSWREDLPGEGLLGSLLLHIRGTPVTDSMVTTQKWRLPDFISKVEVIGNGSEVIKSVSGQVLKYLAWLDGGIAVPDKAFNYGSSTFRMHVPINFGRRLFDLGLGLDLSKWDAVEVQVTNDGSATYFSAAFSLDAQMVILDGADAKPFPGFLRTEEWRKWTTVQNETQYLELPTMYPVRRIILQVMAAATTNAVADTPPYNVAYNIELNLKTGTIKVYDANLRDLWYENAFEHGRDVLAALEPYTTNAYGVHTGLGQVLGASGARLPHDSTQDTYATSIEPGDDGQTLRRVSELDGDQDSWLLLGLALENCAYLRFDHDQNPLTWLDAKAMETVQLNVQTRDASSAASGTIRVILDRYVAR